MFGREATSTECAVSSSSTSDAFQGHAAQFSVFDHVLSANETEALFMAAPSGLEEGLVLAWLNAARGPAPDEDLNELNDRDEWRIGHGKEHVHPVWRDLLRKNDGEFVQTTFGEQMPHWVYAGNKFTGKIRNESLYCLCTHNMQAWNRFYVVCVGQFALDAVAFSTIVLAGAGAGYYAYQTETPWYR